MEAQYALGKLYLSDDDAVHDGKLGMDWLEYAAQNGNSFAAYRAGKEYLRGDFVKKDAAKAVKYLSRAADAGNQYAQYLLGKLYLSGKKVTQDVELAQYRLSQATLQGHPCAEFLLNRMQEQKPPEVLLFATRLLYHLSRIFEDNSLPKTGDGTMRIDRKRLQKLREKK